MLNEEFLRKRECLQVLQQLRGGRWNYNVNSMIDAEYFSYVFFPDYYEKWDFSDIVEYKNSQWYDNERNQISDLPRYIYKNRKRVNEILKQCKSYSEYIKFLEKQNEEAKRFAERLSK